MSNKLKSTSVPSPILLDGMPMFTLMPLNRHHLSFLITFFWLHQSIVKKPTFATTFDGINGHSNIPFCLPSCMRPLRIFVQTLRFR